MTKDWAGHREPNPITITSSIAHLIRNPMPNAKQTAIPMAAKQEQHVPPIGAPSIKKRVECATQSSVFLRKTQSDRRSATKCSRCRSNELDERPSQRRTSTTCNINSNVLQTSNMIQGTRTRSRSTARHGQNEGELCEPNLPQTHQATRDSGTM